MDFDSDVEEKVQIIVFENSKCFRILCIASARILMSSYTYTVARSAGCAQ